MGRLELPSLSAYAPEAYVYTYFTTSAHFSKLIISKYTQLTKVEYEPNMIVCKIQIKVCWV